MSSSSFPIPTPFGAVSVRCSEGSGLPLVMLHGCSLSKAVFERQMTAPLGRHYRIVAIDLPGHGESDDANDPVAAYCLPGYARAVRAVLDRLGIDGAVLYGWSLGGHVALEVAAGWEGALAVVTSGAPPTTPTPEGLKAAFNPHPAFPLFFSPALDEAAVDTFARTVIGDPVPDFVLRDIRRADPRTRPMLLQSLVEGRAADEKAFVETSPVPVALIEGEHEPMVNAGHVASLSFASLLPGGIRRIPAAAHAPFWQNPRAFNEALLAVMRTVARRTGGRPARSRAPQKAREARSA